LVEIDEADGLLLCLLPEEMAQEEWKAGSVGTQSALYRPFGHRRGISKHVSVKGGAIPVRMNLQLFRFKKRRRKH